MSGVFFWFRGWGEVVFLAVLSGLWDPSSQMRDRTWSLGSESVES